MPQAATLISQARGHRRWSLAEAGRAVADRAGRTKPYTSEAVRKWETARATPDRDTAQAIDDLYELGGHLLTEYGYSPAATVTLADLAEMLGHLRDGQGEVIATVNTEIARATEAVTAALERLSGQVESLRRAQSRSTRAASPRR